MPKLKHSEKITLSLEDLERGLQFAKNTLRLAGKEILPLFRSNLDSENKISEGYDPVTLADKKSEALIREEIGKHYPQHGVFGEEEGYTEGNGLTWVIDPIDGTRGFMAGMLHWGMLLALFDGETPVLGVAYQPYSEELFYGFSNSSWLQRADEKEILLKTSSCVDLELAFLGSTDESLFDGALKEKFNKLRNTVRVCRLGGDCYSYCALAMGGLDVAIDPDLKPYDIQALIPIIKGAGGEITTFDGGNPSMGGNVIASANLTLHRQVLEVLNN